VSFVVLSRRATGDAPGGFEVGASGEAGGPRGRCTVERFASCSCCRSDGRREEIPMLTTLNTGAHPVYRRYVT